MVVCPRLQGDNESEAMDERVADWLAAEVGRLGGLSGFAALLGELEFHGTTFRLLAEDRVRASIVDAARMTSEASLHPRLVTAAVQEIAARQLEGTPQWPILWWFSWFRCPSTLPVSF